MAERRMFAKTIIDSDAFLDMPLSTQSLYFHLSMRADDDGFINNPKKIQRMIGASDDDLKLLVAKNFIIPFESGIVVIKHWKIHNYIRNDRYKETVYQEEKALLETKDNKAYTFGIPNGYQMETQVRLGEDSIVKDNIVIIPDSVEPEKPKTKPSKPEKHKYGEFQHVLLTDAEYVNLSTAFGDELRDKAIKFLDEYIEEKGYKSKSHNLAIRRWVIQAVQEQEAKNAKKFTRQEPIPSYMKKSSFNNFQQNQYDFDEIENDLLANGVKTAGNDAAVKAKADALKKKLGGEL